MAKALLIFGTRPEIVKLAPVIKALKAKRSTQVIVGHSGQHYDREMSEVFIHQLGLPAPDFNLNSGSGSHATQIAKVLVGCERAIEQYEPDVVVAEGDTNTVVSVGLASTKLQKGFAHVESGLRSFDRRMPEEVNRIMADHCAELCCAPTKISAANLIREAIPPQRIAVTGNTVVDACLGTLPLARRFSTIQTRLGEWDDFCLLTVHRSENVDTKESLGSLLRLLRGLRERIVYPVHPRTRRRLIEHGYWKLLKKQEHVITLPAVGYWDFLWLLSNCRFAMTDSGGVQEEAFTLGVPCITLRENTERPETVMLGRNFVTGMNLARVKAAMSKVEKMPNSQLKENPFGDGHAGQRIADLLAKNNLRSKVQRARFLSDGYTIRRLIPVTKLKEYRKVRRLMTLCYDEFGRIGLPIKPENMEGWSVELFGEPSVLRPYAICAKKTSGHTQPHLLPSSNHKRTTRNNLQTAGKNQTTERVA